jgi:hypothetical protein
VRDVTDRMRQEARQQAAATAQLRVQRLIADLAARLVTADPAELDAAIVDGLRRVGEALQLDQAVLWQKPVVDASASPSYDWSRTTPSSGAAPEMSSLLLIAA